MSKYAEKTTVPEQQSIAEIDRTVARFGASGFSYRWDAEEGYIEVLYRLRGRVLRHRIPLPDPEEFNRTPTGRKRTTNVATDEYMAERRRRMRSLACLVKALLVAVDDGIVQFDEAMLPFVMVPGGNRTIGEALAPRLEAGYQRGSLLLGDGHDE